MPNSFARASFKRLPPISPSRRQVLLLRKNLMRGRLPASLSDLRSLVALDLSDNAFSGAVPCLAELAKLQVLNVGGNRLGGPLSDSIDTCTRIRPLRLLSLERNRFTGFITCNFGEMTSLRVLSLADNELCGGVPQSLGKLTALVSVDLSFNRLSGAIPFRPKHQRALFQMNFMGNDDLIAPDRWLRVCSSKRNLATSLSLPFRLRLRCLLDTAMRTACLHGMTSLVAPYFHICATYPPNN